MSNWTTPDGRKRLRALLAEPVGADGPTIFGGGDMRDLLDALEAAERARDEARADASAAFATIGACSLRFQEAGFTHADVSLSDMVRTLIQNCREASVLAATEGAKR